MRERMLKEHMIPEGELWEIEAPCQMQLWMRGINMGLVEGKYSKPVVIRGATGGTVLKTRDHLKCKITESADAYRERTTPKPHKGRRRK